jgi:L-fuconolactonase
MPANPAEDSRGNFLLLNPADNIMICAKAVASGTLVKIEGAVVTLPQSIAVGHKIARVALAAGDKVFRYGFPIGTMTAPANVGDHVHGHNLASDYLPAHGRDAVRKIGRE